MNANQGEPVGSGCLRSGQAQKRQDDQDDDDQADDVDQAMHDRSSCCGLSTLLTPKCFASRRGNGDIDFTPTPQL